MDFHSSGKPITVRIPASIVGYRPGIFSPHKVRIYGETLLWSGQLGQVAEFSLVRECRVRIRLGSMIASDIAGTLCPGCHYDLIFQGLRRGKPTFRLVEMWEQEAASPGKAFTDTSLQD